ncbi:MAG: RNA polymerase sigma factor [Marinibacterium sp.]
MDRDHGRLLAALIGQLGDFQLAEDVLQDAMESALTHWGRSGLPDTPRGWLLQVARRKAIDRLRRVARFNGQTDQLSLLMQRDDAADAHEIGDDRLRLIFTCCHPALEQKTRVALTLRTIAGLTTEEIARAFLDKTPAMAQRLSRAKSKIAGAGIPYAVPEGADLAARVAPVLSVIYLIFNEGYAATEGRGQLRRDLCAEAVYLARLMAGFFPDDPEVAGLLALILLTHSRRAARESRSGAYVPLDSQDRDLWDRDLIAEGRTLIAGALGKGRAGPYQIQAAIAALHCEAATSAATDWPQIVALYRLLVQMGGGAVAALNLAVARAHVDGPEAALQDISDLGPDLDGYQPYHAARADLLLRAGRGKAARAAFDRALALTRVASERAWLTARRDSLG